jgi:hypothetical protein
VTETGVELSNEERNLLSVAYKVGVRSREYWMIYTVEDQAFSAVVLFASSPTPLPLSPLSKLSLSFSVFLCVAGSAYWREGGRGAELYDRNKAWGSINRSILSGWFGPDCAV